MGVGGWGGWQSSARAGDGVEGVAHNVQQPAEQAQQLCADRELLLLLAAHHPCAESLAEWTPSLKPWIYE